jgi:hypothetical protein
MVDMKAPFDNVRGMAQMTLDKTREAVDSYLKQSQAAQAGTLEASRKAADYLETNVRATFEFASQLVQAKDITEVTSLHRAFLQAQMDQAKAQMQEIGSSVAATASAFRPKT